MASHRPGSRLHKRARPSRGGSILGRGPLTGRRVLAFLSEASRLLSSSLEVDETLEHLARLAVPALGDWCLTDLLEADGSLRRVAVVHRDPQRVEALWQLHQEYPFCPQATSGPVQVVRTGEPELVRQVSQTLLRKLARDERHLELLRQCEVHSFVTVPLLARGRSLGALTLMVSQAPRGYREADLSLVEDLAGRIAVAVDNALLYESSQRAEAAASAERVRLQAVVENIPLGLLLAEAPSGAPLLGNKALERFWQPGWQGFHLNGRPMESAEWPLARAISNGEVIKEEELEVERPDGTRVSVAVSAAPLRDPEGAISGGVVAFSDITERLAAHRKMEVLATQLANQQRWLESLLDLSPVPLVLVEPQTGEVTFANRSADALAGGTFPREAPEQLPERFSRVYWPDGRPVALEDQPVHRAMRGEPLENLAITWEFPWGGRSLLVSSASLPAMFGHPPTLVFSYLDVSELRRIEQDLERAVRARDDFLSVAAHELRTPITSLRLYTQSLVRSAEGGRLEPEGLAARARHADRQVVRLARLVESVLDLSRIQSGRLDLHPEPVDLVAVVQDAVRQLEDERARAGCEVRLQLPPPLWGQWDRLRLEQVVGNLLSNAFKYGARQPVEVKVELLEGAVALEVRDQGIGVAPEDQDRLFLRFERAVSDRNYGGFGLGLWIVREIVTAMEGTVSVKSTPGAGSVFKVVLPAASAQLRLAAQERA